MTELLGALLDALSRAGVGVMAFDAPSTTEAGGFKKIFANEAAVAALGYTVQEWLDAPAWVTIHPEQWPFVERMYEKIRGDQRVDGVIELILRHKDGSTMRGEYAAARWTLDGKPAFVLVARDIGPSLKAQLSLLESDRLALVGALAAGFAHEINNPLTSVVLNLRSLKKQLGDAQPAAQRCVEDLTLAAERIAGNVRALQTMASTSSGRGVVDLGGVVAAALRLALPTLEPRAIVSKKIVTGLTVAGEEARLAQAVLGMLLFSVSGFAEASGVAPSVRSEMSVVVEMRDEWCVVEVADNGAALSDEEALRAFDPFFRSSSRGAGVGVGLGIARSIAAAMGGDVSLTARDGGGAVMQMRLPLTKS